MIKRDTVKTVIKNALLVSNKQAKVELMENKASQILQTGQRVMRFEADAVNAVADRLDEQFIRAVNLIAEAGSKLVLCGVGKSGHIARKLAATFSSCGVPAVFLHAAEAIHGDLGVFQPGDPTIVFSKSGSTQEVVRLLPVFKKMRSPVIAIVGNMDSPLAEDADIVLDASVQREADPLGLMPTASSTVMLALGDALASTVAEIRGFTSEEFANYHPGGQLGRNLLLSVESVMQPLEKVACVEPEAVLRDVVVAMTRAPLGAACVVDPEGLLMGILTDGDIRRILASGVDILQQRVSQWMTRAPIYITPERLLGDALRVMEDRPSQISVLPVVEGDCLRVVGLLRLHDAYQPAVADR
jgi:arabinose-5-phosphate isomerase